VKIDARFLVRLYPRKWRERYGGELTALLEDSGLSGPRVALDLAIGALREQLRAAFVTVSPKTRQSALRLLVSLSSWAAGAAIAAAIASFLPDFAMGGAMRAWFMVSGLVGSLSVFFYLSVLKKDATAGLAAGVPPLTPWLAGVLAILATGVAVLGDVGVAHSWREGRASLFDAWVGGLSNCLMFQPLGVGIAAMIWPERFRDLDLDPPHSSSTLGLGA
jgi:hypothetical protein